MAKERIPAKLQPSVASTVKAAWKKSNSHLSLKAWARSGSSGLGEASATWFANKRLNTSKPPLGLGKTRRKKSKNGAPLKDAKK
jgi:hypothetical protein